MISMMSDDEWSNDEGSDWGDCSLEDELTDQSIDHSINQSVPRDVKSRVRRDICELRMIDPFVSSDVLIGRAATITVRVGFAIESLNLHIEQARAWSLPTDGYLLAEISTPAYYFDTTDRTQIKVSVGLAPDLSLQDDQPPLEKCKVSWPLLDALKRKVMPGTAGNPGFHLEDAQMVMDSCDCSILTAVSALREFGDAATAIDKITSNNFKRSASSPTRASTYESWAQRSVDDNARSVSILKLDKVGTKRSMVMNVCGVTDPVARQAIKACDGDVQAAIMLLLAAGDDVDHLDELKEDSSVAGVAESSSDSSFFGGSSLVPEELVNMFAGHNFLVRIAAFMLGRLTILSSLCMMCHKPLPHVGLNLTICSHDLCRTSYEKMGVGFDLAAQIKASPVLTDLYLSLLFVAATSSHVPFAFPSDVAVTDKDGKDHGFRTSAKEEDFVRLTLALQKLPAVDDLIKWIDAGTFYSECDKLDILIVPLLRWIFQSNPSYLRELQPHERLKSLNTPHQFILLMSSPEKETHFQAKKAAFPTGSIYAWHGSPLKNWFSILRVGLKSMSGTKYQAHGAMYGAGIYLAPDSHTSRGYCGHISGGWPKSRFGINTTALALCEVVATPHFNPHLVIGDESACMTRYLCLFDGSTGLEQAVDAKHLVREMHPSLRNFNPASAISSHRHSPR